MSDTNTLSKLRYLQTLLAIAVEKIPPRPSPFPSIRSSFLKRLSQKSMWRLGLLPY